MAQGVEKAKSRQPTRRDVEMAQAQAQIASARASLEKWRHIGRRYSSACRSVRWRFRFWLCAA